MFELDDGLGEADGDSDGEEEGDGDGEFDTNALNTLKSSLEVYEALKSEIDAVTKRLPLSFLEALLLLNR